MSIKFYDSNGKYWGEYDETRSLFIPSEEVLADRKTEPTGYNLKPVEDEPQTDRSMAIGKRSDATADKYNLYGKTTTDESQTDCAWGQI